MHAMEKAHNRGLIIQKIEAKLKPFSIMASSLHDFRVHHVEAWITESQVEIFSIPKKSNNREQDTKELDGFGKPSSHRRTRGGSHLLGGPILSIFSSKVDVEHCEASAIADDETDDTIVFHSISDHDSPTNLTISDVKNRITQSKKRSALPWFSKRKSTGSFQDKMANRLCVRVKKMMQEESVTTMQDCNMVASLGPVHDAHSENAGNLIDLDLKKVAANLLQKKKRKKREEVKSCPNDIPSIVRIDHVYDCDQSETSASTALNTLSDDSSSIGCMTPSTSALDSQALKEKPKKQFNYRRKPKAVTKMESSSPTQTNISSMPEQGKTANERRQRRWESIVKGLGPTVTSTLVLFLAILKSLLTDGNPRLTV